MAARRGQISRCRGGRLRASPSCSLPRAVAGRRMEDPPARPRPRRRDRAQRRWPRRGEGACTGRRRRLRRGRFRASRRELPQGARAHPVLSGDVTSPALLERSRLDRATAVVIATGSDSRSLQVLGACEQALHRARRKPSLHVELESPELWTELHRIGFTGAGRTSRVEFFSRLTASRVTCWKEPQPARRYARSSCTARGRRSTGSCCTPGERPVSTGDLCW